MKNFILNRNEYFSTLSSNLNVLDIGCVNHNLTQYKVGEWLHNILKKSAKSLVGIDKETDCIDILKNQGYDVYAVDAENFNLNKKFDLIVAGEVMEHLSNPGNFLDCAKAHLYTDGQLVISVPNASSLNYFIQNLFFEHEKDNTDHCLLFSKITITRLLEKHGFNVKSINYCTEQNWDGSGISHICRKYLGYICSIFRPNLCHHLVVLASLK